VPEAALAAAAKGTVREEESPGTLRLLPADTPAGSPSTNTETEPVKPPDRKTETVTSPWDPWSRERLEGATVMEKE